MNIRGLFGRRNTVRAQQRRIEWCHGDAMGYSSIVSNGVGTTVTVKCSDCQDGRWDAVYKACAQCRSVRHSTSSVRSGEDGYVVTFTCIECGTRDVHRQADDY